MKGKMKLQSNKTPKTRRRLQARSVAFEELMAPG